MLPSASRAPSSSPRTLLPKQVLRQRVDEPPTVNMARLAGPYVARSFARHQVGSTACVCRCRRCAQRSAWNLIQLAADFASLPGSGLSSDRPAGQVCPNHRHPALGSPAAPSALGRRAACRSDRGWMNRYSGMIPRANTCPTRHADQATEAGRLAIVVVVPGSPAGRYQHQRAGEQ